MPILPFEGFLPRIHPSAFIAPNAWIIGNVEIGEGASVWYGCTVRGDLEPIIIGARSNIQDGSVLHTDTGHPTVIAEDVTVGHMACVHGCRIGARALIGISATVLTGAVIPEDAVVAAGALVSEGKSFEPGSLIIGIPAKAIRPATAEERARFARGKDHYVRNGARHSAALSAALLRDE